MKIPVSVFLTAYGRKIIRERAEYESAEQEARALGIEDEAKALHRARQAAAMGTFERPPTLKQCVLEIIAKPREDES